MTDVIIALISGLCVAIPTLVTSVLSNKSNKDLIMYRLEELSKKVEKHNNVVERMAIAEKDLKAVWRNIDELKGDRK